MINGSIMNVIKLVLVINQTTDWNDFRNIFNGWIGFPFLFSYFTWSIGRESRSTCRQSPACLSRSGGIQKMGENHDGVERERKENLKFNCSENKEIQLETTNRSFLL